MLDYVEYLASTQWRARATAAKKRAGWQCALCCCNAALEVHHRTYARVGHEDPTDLIVLCADCHGRHHGVLPDQQRFKAQIPEWPEWN